MFKFRVWCRDCYAYNHNGCFEGGTEDSDIFYNTFKEADEAGYECARQSIWEYEVVDIKTDEVVIE